VSIKFSFVGCAIRSELYYGLCESIAKSNSNLNSSYEIIFAGSAPPIQKMPNNFKYIVTQTHPAWATEVAVRHAKGEYLIVISDDAIFSDGYLGILDHYISKIGMEKCVVGGRFRYANHKECNDSCLTIDDKHAKAPVHPMGGAYKRDVWNELGGVDNRFFGSYYDLDMGMRFYEKGFVPFVMPDAYYSENRHTTIPSCLWKKTGKAARETMNKLWVKNGEYSLKRLSPVQSITDEYIKSSIEKIID
jgi:hypothetical protein